MDIPPKWIYHKKWHTTKMDIPQKMDRPPKWIYHKKWTYHQNGYTTKNGHTTKMDIPQKMDMQLKMYNKIGYITNCRHISKIDLPPKIDIPPKWIYHQRWTYHKKLYMPAKRNSGTKCSIICLLLIRQFLSLSLIQNAFPKVSVFLFLSRHGFPYKN